MTYHSIITIQVRVRVTFQIARDPRQNASSEWSDYVKVHGITTLPTVSTPPVTKGVSDAPGLTTMGLLLLIILLTVAVIIVVAIVTSAIVVVKCLRK